MSTQDIAQQSGSSQKLDKEALLERLRSDAPLLPGKFRDYYLNYAERDLDRCETTLSFMPPSSEAQPLSVLEVGSFPGVMSIVVKHCGYQIDCIDLNPERMQVLMDKNGLDVRRCDIETEDLPFADDRYDVVIFTEVLEHLRVNPLHALRELKRVLKPGGTLVLTVPNISPVHRLKFLFGVDYQGDIVHEFEKLDRLGHMGHIRVYSEQEVRRMLEYAGLKIKEVTPAGRLNLPSGGLNLLLKAISIAGMIHPKAEFSTKRDAFSSHLYVTATA